MLTQKNNGLSDDAENNTVAFIQSSTVQKTRL